MPIIKSAIKRMRQEGVRRERNKVTKTEMRKAIKATTTKPTADKLSAAQSEIDKAVKKGLLKKNTAARKKSALAKLAKVAGVKLTTKKKAAAKSVAKKPAAKAVAKKAPTKAPVKKAVAKTPTKKPVTKKATTAKKPATKKPTATKKTK